MQPVLKTYRQVVFARPWIKVQQPMTLGRTKGFSFHSLVHPVYNYCISRLAFACFDASIGEKQCTSVYIYMKHTIYRRS